MGGGHHRSRRFCRSTRTLAQVVRTVTIDGRPSALAVASTICLGGRSRRGPRDEIDAPSGKTLATVDVGGGPVALALDPRCGLGREQSRRDRLADRSGDGRVVATVAVGSGPSGIAVAGDSVWVTNQYVRTLTRIDARSNRVAATIRTRGQPMAVAAGEDAVWVGAGAAAATHRGGTLTLATTNRFASIDPAFQNLATPNQFGKLAFDTLVTFQATGGTSGLRLVPDLALALPPRRTAARATRSACGAASATRTEAAACGDFRRAIERLFRVGSQGADYFSGLVGSAACAREPKRCDLARGIRTDDAAGTVEFRLTAPDPDFLYKLTPFSYAAPIPPGTPERDAARAGARHRAVSAPAVARRADHVSAQPRFREWSHAAQPDGNPDRIVWRFYPSFEAETRAVRAGRADWIFGILPPRELGQLGLELPAQLHDNPTFIVDFIPLNTHARALRRRPRPAGAQPRDRSRQDRRPCTAARARRRRPASRCLRACSASGYCPYTAGAAGRRRLERA